MGGVGGGSVRETEKAKRKDIKSSGRQKDLLAVRWFWLFADENSSVDAIPACARYTVYRDESLALFCAYMEMTVGFIHVGNLINTDCACFQ